MAGHRPQRAARRVCIRPRKNVSSATPGAAPIARRARTKPTAVGALSARAMRSSVPPRTRSKSLAEPHASVSPSMPIAAAPTPSALARDLPSRSVPTTSRLASRAATRATPKSAAAATAADAINPADDCANCRASSGIRAASPDARAAATPKTSAVVRPIASANAAKYAASAGQAAARATADGAGAEGEERGGCTRQSSSPEERRGPRVRIPLGPDSNQADAVEQRVQTRR
jgi:hypothetical protein